MSRTLCRVFGKVNRINAGTTSSALNMCHVNVAHYSKRNNAEDLEKCFKVVKSKVRIEDDYASLEGGPNWELLSPRGNRFYFPNSTGPAWQGANSTITVDEPLSSLVDFSENQQKRRQQQQQQQQQEQQQQQHQSHQKKRLYGYHQKTQLEQTKLNFKIDVCPALLKNSLHEIFPAPEVISSKTLTILLLSFNGDIEKGAAKFVLAAREISERLRLHGFWADFMNPFSGKPFFSWASGKNLYKVDERFRGLNMKLTNQNSCTVISTAENVNTSFSGAIYTTAPSEIGEFKSILMQRLYGDQHRD